MIKLQSYVMLILLNVTMEPSNVRKKIKKPLNVTKVLPIVTIKPSNVRKKIREPSVVTISFLKNYFIKSVNFTHKEKRVYNQFNELEKYQVVCKLQSSKTKTKAKHLI